MWNFLKSFFKTGLAVIGAPLVALSVMAASLVLVGAYGFEIATTSFKKAGFAKNLGRKDSEKHLDTAGAALKSAMWGYIKGCAGLYTELGTEIKDLMNDTLDKSGRGSETPKNEEFSAIIRKESEKRSVFAAAKEESKDSFTQQVVKLISRLENKTDQDTLSNIYKDDLKIIYDKTKILDNKLTTNEAIKLLTPLLVLAKLDNKIILKNEDSAEKSNIKALNEMEYAISKLDTYPLNVKPTPLTPTPLTPFAETSNARINRSSIASTKPNTITTTTEAKKAFTEAELEKLNNKNTTSRAA